MVIMIILLSFYEINLKACIEIELQYILKIPIAKLQEKMHSIFDDIEVFIYGFIIENSSSKCLVSL